MSFCADIRINMIGSEWIFYKRSLSKIINSDLQMKMTQKLISRNIIIFKKNKHVDNLLLCAIHLQDDASPQLPIFCICKQYVHLLSLPVHVLPLICTNSLSRLIVLSLYPYFRQFVLRVANFPNTLSSRKFDYPICLILCHLAKF